MSIPDRNELVPADEVVEGVLDDRLLVPITEAETYDEAILTAFRERVAEAVEDAIAYFESRRGIVNFSQHHIDRETAHAEVRMIARSAARLALGLQRNPDRIEFIGRQDGV